VPRAIDSHAQVLRLPLGRGAEDSVRGLFVILAGGVAGALGLLLCLTWTAGDDKKTRLIYTARPRPCRDRLAPWPIRCPVVPDSGTGRGGRVRLAIPPGPFWRAVNSLEGRLDPDGYRKAMLRDLSTSSLLELSALLKKA
jgi:hypothetical protein